MRTIEFIDDFGGEAYFAPQSKQPKNPFFQINVLTGFHPGIAESKGSCSSCSEILPLAWSITILQPVNP